MKHFKSPEHAQRFLEVHDMWQLISDPNDISFLLRTTKRNDTLDSVPRTFPALSARIPFSRFATLECAKGADHCSQDRAYTSPAVNIAVARSKYNPVPSASIVAGHSGHITRIKSSQLSSFSRNFRGRA